jgi:Carboxypeptidase regulatory-like domain
MKKVIALILVSLTIAACGESPVRPSRPIGPAPTLAPTVFYAVSGVVVQRGVSGDQPIEGAAVSVADDFSTFSATTDGEGRFSLSVTAAGTWQLTASKDGYETTTMTIEVAEDMTVAVELAPMPAN